jgi:hypothetical protein
MDGHIQLRVAFTSTDSHKERAVVVMDVNQSIRIEESLPLAARMSATEGYFGKITDITVDAASNAIVQYPGAGILLAVRLGAIPQIQANQARASGGAVAATGCRRRCGEVACWKPDKRSGFIRDAVTGESFWFSARQLVYSDSAESLAVGTRLAFVTAGTAKGKKCRQAGAILVVGEQADGLLVSHPVGRRHGWVRVEGEQGGHQMVYVPQRELSGCKVGDILTFVVAMNDRGAFASRVERLAADKAA